MIDLSGINDMSMFNVEYKRIKPVLIRVAIAVAIIFTIIYLNELISEGIAGEVWLGMYLYPFIAAVISLAIAGRGAKSGWRCTDLSLPLNRSRYAREGLGYVYKIYFFIMTPALLAFIVYIFLPRYELSTRPLLAPFIMGTIYSLFTLGILTPSLATGFYRGSFGWWALFALGILFMTWIPWFLLRFILSFGIRSSYALLFLPAGPLVAILGYFNTIWYFKHKADLG